MKKGIQIVIALFSISFPALSQSQIVGRVIDSETKKPVRNASVFVMDKDTETISNYLGYFQIAADSSDLLVVKVPFYETGVINAFIAKSAQVQITKRKQSDYEGGVEKFIEYLAKNARYPQAARRNGTQGQFYVSFTIDSLGQMGNIKTIEDIGDDCGSVFLAMLEGAPNLWIPAETVTTFILPVTFRLGDSVIEKKEVELPQGVILNELFITAYGVMRTTESLHLGQTPH